MGQPVPKRGWFAFHPATGIFLPDLEAGSAVPKDASASSAFVVRSDPEQFGIGTDNYDFSQLNPGWVVESVQLQTYSVSCPEVGTSAHNRSGVWEAEWALRGVTSHV